MPTNSMTGYLAETTATAMVSNLLALFCRGCAGGSFVPAVLLLNTANSVATTGATYVVMAIFKTACHKTYYLVKHVDTNTTHYFFPEKPKSNNWEMIDRPATPEWDNTDRNLAEPPRDQVEELKP